MKQFLVVIFGVLALAVLPSAAHAQGRGFLTVDFGMQKPKDRGFFQNFTQPSRGETAEFDADYDYGTVPLFSVGAGAMFNDWFGVGATYSQTSKTGDVIAFASLPDAFRFNNDATAEATFGDFKRTERAIHIHGIYAITAGRVGIRLSGGPTYFRLSQDLVNDIRYTESNGALPTQHTLRIDTVLSDTYDASGWGFNVGGDVAVYFTEAIGVGGLIRYTRADVPLTFALGTAAGETDPLDNRVGGLQFGGGLRVRF